MERLKLIKLALVFFTSNTILYSQTNIVAIKRDCYQETELDSNSICSFGKALLDKQEVHKIFNGDLFNGFKYLSLDSSNYKQYYFVNVHFKKIPATNISDVEFFSVNRDNNDLTLQKSGHDFLEKLKRNFPFTTVNVIIHRKNGRSENHDVLAFSFKLYAVQDNFKKKYYTVSLSWL
ncbi:MAG: hypothetical protein ACT6QS_08130 [Flavobacteriales bacterium]